MYRAGELSEEFTSSLMAIYCAAFKRPTAICPLTLSVIAHTPNVMCGRQNNSPLKISRSSVFMNMLPNVAKWTVDMTVVQTLQMEELSWIIQVGPI